MVIVLESGGYVVTVSERVLELTGYSRAELIGRSCSLLFAPAGPMKKLCDSAVRQGRRLRRVEAELVAGDYSRTAVTLDMAPIKLGRKVGGSVVVARRVSGEQSGSPDEETLDVIIVVDDSQRILFASPSTRRVLGYLPSELLGKKVTLLLPNRTRLEEGERWSNSMERGGKWPSLPGSFPVVCKDGREITVDVAPGRFSFGARALTAAVIRNASEPAQLKDQLRASEERYRMVVEAQSDLICRFLPDTTLTFVNDAYCRYFSKRREEVLGTRFLRFIPESSHSLIRAHVRSLVEKPTSQEGHHEHPIIAPGGNIGWMHWMNRAIIDADGTVRELQGIGRDITELKRLQDDLVRREQEFSSLMQNLPDIVSRLDGDLRFVYVSPNVKSLFGISADQFLGKRPREIGVPSHDWFGFEDACRPVFATGEAADREFVWADRSYRARIVPEPGPAGRTESVLCIDQDITSQKRIEGELRMLSSRLLDLQDAERRRLARHMHDSTAQNLFAIALMLSRLLEQGKRSISRSTLEECLSLCEQSREEIRTLSYVLHPPLLDDVGLVPAIRWFTEGFSKRTGIEVEFIVTRKAPRLSREIATDLFRVVQESLSNVHRHSGSRTATVRPTRTPDGVMLQICDSGCGLSAGVPHAPGNSLGVGILGMRERLAQLNGKLEIKSGKGGTTITALVPMPEATATPLNAAGRQKVF